jgi:hypothetical protein
MVASIICEFVGSGGKEIMCKSCARKWSVQTLCKQNVRPGFVQNLCSDFCPFGQASDYTERIKRSHKPSAAHGWPLWFTVTAAAGRRQGEKSYRPHPVFDSRLARNILSRLLAHSKGQSEKNFQPLETPDVKGGQTGY